MVISAIFESGSAKPIISFSNGMGRLPINFSRARKSISPFPKLKLPVVSTTDSGPEIFILSKKMDSCSRRKGELILSSNSWKQAHSDDYEIGKQLFSSLQCVQCHAVNRTGIGAKGPNLTLYGLRTSLAAGWMRNDRESLAKWLKNSQEIKFGNLMWNGEGVGDNHPLRQLENDDLKVNQLIDYLLGQI